MGVWQMTLGLRHETSSNLLRASTPNLSLARYAPVSLEKQEQRLLRRPMALGVRDVLLRQRPQGSTWDVLPAKIK